MLPAFLPAPVLSPPTTTRFRTYHPPRCALQPPPTPKPPTQTPPPPTPRLSNLEVFLERLSDTLLDARLHYSRLLTRQPPVPVDTTTPHVVILGSGWAAHSLIKVLDPYALPNVTLISPRNFFFFTPLLNASAVGTVEFRSIVEPIRKSNPFVKYFEAAAEDIDVENGIVVCKKMMSGEKQEATFEIPYDVLVIAVGETTATFGVKGAREYASFLKEISDARNLRVKLLDTLEKAALPVWTPEQRADLLHFVVVGGGPTGCEFAGELSDFVASDLAPRYGKELVSLIRVTLLQSGKSILTQFETSLQNRALDNFRGRVRIRLRVRVSEVTKEEVVLQSGERIRYGILVWAAGNGTRPIVTRLLQKVEGTNPEENGTKRRKIPVDAWLRVKGAKRMFALGDCTVIEGGGLPATAQVAGQQGAFLGRLLSKADPETIDAIEGPVIRAGKGKRINPFRFLSLGIMAYLGNDRAVVQVQATDKRSINIGGRIAYTLWRSVYAVKQVDVRNRVLVLFDYFKTRVFGRDISQF